MAKVEIDPEQLLRRGLLPENLPPVFHSRDLWSHMVSPDGGYVITSGCVGQPAIYNSSKRGDQRRIFSIPHPAFVRDQAIFLKRHWAKLASIIDSDFGSASVPSFYSRTARHVRITPHSELPRLRLQRFSRFKYCLTTDVARFYPSIYTHSIPWAINGKAVAKADTKANSASVFGNKLDFLVRQAQSRQTIGIPVGPDVSKITAELVMAAVDKVFVERSGQRPPVFLRHVDDYWIGGNSQEECEKHLHNLRSALREYELDINENKTRIVSAKAVFGEKWPHSFARQLKESLPASILGSSQSEFRSSADALNVLNDLVEQAVSSGDDGIIRYALKKIDEHRLWSLDWPLFQDFLAQCAVQFPHSADYVMRVVAWRNRVSVGDVDRQLWVDVASVSASHAGSLGRDSEVLWSLWMLKELKQRIPKAVTDQVVGECGPLVLAFLAHCSRKGLTADRRLKSKLWERVEGIPFSGQWWPLTLEMCHLSMADPAWSSASAAQPDIMRILHQRRASIVDWDAPPKVFISDDGSDGPDHDDGPDYAIEDYGADYDEDEEEDEDEPNDPVGPPGRIGTETFQFPGKLPEIPGNMPSLPWPPKFLKRRRPIDPVDF